MSTEETDQITLEDLLQDAATVLEKQEGYKGLARAVRMALAERGAIPEGEKWVADICVALERAEQVIAAAHTDPNAVDLSAMEDALEVVAGWGLSPDHRLGNFLRHTIVRLENVCTAIEMQMVDGATVLPEHALTPIQELLEDFGFPRKATDAAATYA